MTAASPSPAKRPRFWTPARATGVPDAFPVTETLQLAHHVCARNLLAAIMETMSWTDDRLDNFAAETATRFDRLEQRIDVRFDEVDRRFEKMDERFEKMDER